MKNHTQMRNCLAAIRRIFGAGSRSTRVVNVAFIPDVPKPVPVAVRTQK